jgi:hypothetical protein
LRIGERLFGNGIWKVFDSDARGQFSRIAKNVLKDMQETEFHRYLQRVTGVFDEWTLLRLPETERKNMSRASLRFQKAVRDYKIRLQNDMDYSGRHVDQLSLADVEKGFMPEATKDSD